MKKVFTIAAIAGLMSCNDEPQPIILGGQFDFTQDEGISDSLVYDEYEPGEFVSDSIFIANQAYIDSLTTVNELLEHLETLPSQ